VTSPPQFLGHRSDATAYSSVWPRTTSRPLLSRSGSSQVKADVVRG
jgi:hypothetical protein